MNIEREVSLPDSLRPSEILKFSIELQALEDADCYTFDFGRTRWFPPFSMLLLSSMLRRFKQSHEGARMRARNHENHEYAAHLGFFQSFGLGHGNRPGEAVGSDTYVPIQQLLVHEIQDYAFESFREVGDVIEEKSKRLATLLSREEEGPLFQTLTFSIREIVRNIVEHSESPEILLCGQYWPSKGHVEVGIADFGIGVKEGLAGNVEYKDLNDREALYAALMPGISGNPFAGMGNDYWQNSGYGLYMTNRICRNGGSFFICSGNSGVRLTSTRKQDIECDVTGTSVRLFLNTNYLADLAEQLQRFRDEGEEAANKFDGTSTGFASSASTMLSRDFEE
ncbi:hypothetical protein [Ruegeria sp. HKCCA5763]|uniref:hypothetical protein n=1 Tax=Ruegeria sp. HKCCA5763 TaxID=2682987 RepID=UPI00148966DE|nr:hypothetical protein [Ruegeria sp. HKCCA5763]